MHTEGPLLVFAGAGSGKTRVITHRIAYLIYEKQIEPSNILAVTFTKKAAEEMKNRVTDILMKLEYVSAQQPLIGTFHSIAALLLRKDGDKIGLDRNFTIIDQDDAENLVKELLLDSGYDPKKTRPKAVLSYIDDAKNNMISPQAYHLHYSGFVEDIVAEIYPRYQERLRAMNSVDFGDLLYYISELFSSVPEVLKKYQDHFKYILVDEYQDTNKVQYEIVRNLAGDDQNLCVVGDDDQGIYKWRGADIKNIINFQNDFPDVKVIKLEQNYRSTANVINAAVSVIKRNNQRVDKSLWTEKGDGDKITVYQAEDEKDESEFVVDEIEEMLDGGDKRLSDFAVLYRTNYQSRAIEEALLKRNFPYKLVGGFRFYDRKEIKDLISYARFIANPKDYVSLLRIINVPTRKMGSKSISTLASIAKKAECGVGELLVTAYWYKHSDLPDDLVDEQLIPRVETLLPELAVFERLVDTFGSLYFDNQGVAPDQLIKNVIRAIKYIDYIDDGTEAAEMKKENIEELINVSKSYGDSLQNFLEGIALIESEQDKNEAEGDNSNRITLMTLHASKGLEFPVVFILGMEEGIMPHSRSFTSPEDLEEERRLCYVGITRAKDKLYMTFAESRMTGGVDPYGRIPSRFLGEIPQDICEYFSWNA